MPAITSKSIIDICAPIATAYRKAGKNWDAQAHFSAMLKIALTEMGCTESLTDDMKPDREATVKIMMQMGYPKNWQESYLAMTPSGEKDADGKPIMMMPKVAKTEKAVELEFA